MGLFENFPYTNFHELNLTWFLDTFRQLLTEWEEQKREFADLKEAWDELRQFVTDYFDNLDVQQEINNKLDAMARSGELAVILQPFVPSVITQWLNDNITPTSPPVDDSLTVEDAAADAKETGVRIKENRTKINSLWDDLVLLETVNNYNAHNVTMVVDPAEGTVTVNGTANANSTLYTNTFTGIDKIYLSGTPAGGSGTTYFLGVYKDGERIDYVTNESEKYVTLDPAETYKLGVTVMNGVTANNLVFKPKAYGTGVIDTILDDILESVADLPDLSNRISKYEEFQGVAFITVCGNKLIIDPVTFQLFNKETGATTTAINDTQTLNLTVTTLRFVLFDGAAFSLSATYDNSAVGYTYLRTFTSFIDSVIPDYRRIQNGYIRSGSAYYLNFERIPMDAYMQYGSSDYKFSERSYAITSAKNMYYRLKKTDIPFTITENTVDLSNKKILMIGDSFVNRGWIQKYITDLVPTISFIGTRTTQYYNFKSEGISGSRLYDFTEAGSPFMFNDTLSLYQYLNTNNLPQPDYVVINSAINHARYVTSGHGNYFENLMDLVDMVKNYNTLFNADIKIYVTFGCNYAMLPASNAAYPSSSRFPEVRKCCNSVYGVEGITVIPFDQALTDIYDYPSGSVEYLENDIPVITDNVHPNEQSGFAKLAQMLYNYLGI